MTTTKSIYYTVRCDIGTHCQDKHQNVEQRTVARDNVHEAYAVLRSEGWQLGGNNIYSPAVCSYCTKRVPKP